jgi:hypothetical protein
MEPEQQTNYDCTAEDDAVRNITISYISGIRSLKP